MRKIALVLLLVFTTVMITSCVTKQTCSAYGEKQRYQRNWNK